MSRSPRVALVFVPQGEPAMPHIALPLLKAYLCAEAGVDADVYDLNIGFYRELLSLPASAESLAVLDGREWSAEGYPRALREAIGACGSFSRRHPACRLSFKGLSLPGWDRSSASLLRLVESSDNPFVRFFAPHIETLSGYDVVGVSLCWSGQLLPLFTLARMLRAAAPRTVMVLGGSLVPHLLEPLLAAPFLLEPFDYLVPYEGERPLAAIVSSVVEDRGPADIPGAFALPRREAGETRHPRPPAVLSSPLPPDRLPTPDFSGLPVDDYLSPVRVLPVLSTRGCHYGACAYCDHDRHVSGHVRRPLPQVIADLDAFWTRWRARHLYFVDDSMPAAVLDGLATALANRRDGPPGGVRFLTSTRLESALTGELLRRAAAAGAHALLFGLESGSQLTLDRMRTGVRLAEAGRVLADAHAAGIVTWCFFMVGCPGEGPDGLAATFEYLRRQRPVVDVIAGGPFVMTRGSALARSRLAPSGPSSDVTAGDLALTQEWRREDGLTHADVADALTVASRGFRGVYASLPAFIEAHALALSQRDYQHRFVAATPLGPS